MKYCGSYFKSLKSDVAIVIKFLKTFLYQLQEG